MSRGRVACALVLVVAALAVARGTSAQEVREYVGTFSPLRPGIDEYLTGSPIVRNSGRAIERRSGCDSDIPEPDLPEDCRDAIRIANDFAASIDGLVTPAIKADLSAVVLVGSIRGLNGELLVPSISRLLPVILQLAAQANAGDDEALVAMRRLAGALIALDMGAFE